MTTNKSVVRAPTIKYKHTDVGSSGAVVVVVVVGSKYTTVMALGSISRDVYTLYIYIYIYIHRCVVYRHKNGAEEILC